MSTLGVEGLRAERDATLTIAKSLTDDEWNAPSDCDGWAVRDVIAHMAQHPARRRRSVGDARPEPAAPRAAWRRPVAERRSWTIEEVLAEFETYSGQVADLGATLQDPPLSETLLPMGDLGTHPMAIMPSTFLFDNYCHLRNDILKPNGPIDRPQPPRDEKRLAPTVEWMLAGLPWMCADELAFVDRPITLVLTGCRRRHVVDRARRRRRPRARERRDGRGLGRDGHFGHARLRGLGHATPAVEPAHDDRRRRGVRGPRPRRRQDHLSGAAAAEAGRMRFNAPRSPAPSPDEPKCCSASSAGSGSRSWPTADGLTEEQLRWTPDGRLAPDHRRHQPSRAHGVALGRRPLPRLGVPGSHRRVRARDPTSPAPKSSTRTPGRPNAPNASCAPPRASMRRASARKPGSGLRISCSGSTTRSTSAGCCCTSSKRPRITPVTPTRPARCSTAVQKRRAELGTTQARDIRRAGRVDA